MRFLSLFFILLSSAATAQTTEELSAVAESMQALDSMYIMLSAAFVLGSFTTVILIIALDAIKKKRAK